MKDDVVPEDVSLAAEREAAKRELARANLQRDFALRLLRRQQLLDSIYRGNTGRNALLQRMLRCIPGGIKDIVPLPIKRLLQRALMRIR